MYDSDYKTFTLVQTFAASGENAANLVWGLGIGQKRRFITQENSQKTIHAGIGYNRRHKKPEVPRTKLHVISQNRWMLDGCSMLHCPDDEGAFVERNFHKIYRLDYNIPFPEPTITSDLRLSA